MEKPKHHIFLCASFRASGEQQGICYKKGTSQFLSYIENELADRGMTDVVVTATGCLKSCDRGPVMIVYPDNFWYGGVESEDIIDDILDALEDGNAAEGYLLT